MGRLTEVVRSEFKPSFSKILECILFIIGNWPGRNPPTQYEIVKSVFVADLTHLNEYGRPITFDNYAALEFGPVPENTYDILKPTYKFFKQKLGISGPLWKTRKATWVSSDRAMGFFDANRPANERILSLSDRRALTKAMEAVLKLGFGGVRDWTHTHPAYKKAWEFRGDKGSAPMNPAMLLDDDDEETILELCHASKYI